MRVWVEKNKAAPARIDAGLQIGPLLVNPN
jgi:hypothetical protein